MGSLLRWTWCLTLIIGLTVGPAFGAQNDNVKQDLFAVITLKGHRCGEVVSVKKLGENDYIATCRSGDRYRVHLGPKDKVLVEKQ